LRFSRHGQVFMKKILLILSFFCLALASEAHPVHVSVCNIEIKEDKTEVFLKIFKDDFLLAIEHNFGKLIELDTIYDAESLEIIKKYLFSSFNISMNKKDTLRLEYQGSDINEEAVWFYFESKTPKTNKINIKNTLLLDIYIDQTNLVIINNNGKQRGYRLNFDNYSEVIDLRK
jgi:hypothetical protein